MPCLQHWRRDSSQRAEISIMVRAGQGSTADGSQLSATGKRALQARMREVDFVFVDEMFMVSQDLLGLMGIRGGQAVEGRTPDGSDDRVFGCLNLILAGDPMQLPLVGGAPVWAEWPSDTERAIQGRVVWLGINACVELTEIIRQQDAEHAAFRVTLRNIVDGREGLDDFNYIRKRG